MEDDIPHGFGVKLETRMIAGEQKKSNSGPGSAAVDVVPDFGCRASGFRVLGFSVRGSGFRALLKPPFWFG